jgi:hypothetical protein
MHNAEQLQVLSVSDLKAIAETLMIPKSKITKSKKPELIELILKKAEEASHNNNRGYENN